MSIVRRFAHWLDRDDRVKEQALDAIAGGASEEQMLKRIGADAVTFRTWLREDPEFARAVRVARTEGPHEPAIYFWRGGEIVSSRDVDPDAPPPIAPPPGSSDWEIEQQGWSRGLGGWPGR